jgi:hypothetical protein
MSQTPALSRLLPFVDAWFDIVASFVGAQRSITYALLHTDEPAEPTGRAQHMVPVPDGWRDTSA